MVWLGIMPTCAGLAQLVEHLIRNEGVVGSSPITGTTKLSVKKHRQMPVFLYVFITRIAPFINRAICTVWAQSFAGISTMQNHYMIND